MKIYQKGPTRLEAKDIPAESPIPDGWFANKAEALGVKEEAVAIMGMPEPADYPTEPATVILEAPKRRGRPPRVNTEE